MSRLESLLEILKNDENDAFSRYALALEYMSMNETVKAKIEYLKLLNDQPAYLPVYYQLGKLYEHEGDLEEAKNIYNKGLFVATSQNELHTKNELQEAIDNLY
ncbi:MAG: tetratricopeptide repeat protein [Ignavibacteria bacterium]|nr:tetratricopeptide repeat protein [Ignavibacteria bacterium]